MHNTPHSEASKQLMSQKRLGIPNVKKRRPTLIVDGIIMYRCSTCHKYFTYDNFYSNKRTLLGITSDCKKCHMEAAVRTRDKDLHRNNRKLSARRMRLEKPDLVRERDRLRKRVKDEKTVARSALNSAVKSRRIKKPDMCSICGKHTRITGHHTDYSKPLDVQWVCYECHANIHRVISFKRIENV